MIINTIACRFIVKMSRQLDVEPFQQGNRLHTSESDVCRRQILMLEFDPHNEKVTNSPWARGRIFTI